MKRLAAPLIAVLAMILPITMASPGAAAADPCFIYVSHDLTLDADTACTIRFDGNVVQPVSDLVVDLNGHSAGRIDMFWWHGRPATVKNGSVSGDISIGRGTLTVSGVSARGMHSLLGGDLRIDHSLVQGEDTYGGVTADHGLASISDSVVTHNLVGVDAGFGGSITMTRTQAVRNDFAGAAVSLGGGIEITYSNLSENAWDGFHQEFHGGASITDSTLDHNGHDGLYIEYCCTLRNLHLWGNGNLGAENVQPAWALPPDNPIFPPKQAPGLWAKHNGDPRQCVNITCSTTGRPKG